VQAYDEHEYNTLKDVIAQRGTNTDAAAAEIKTMINAVAEQYPALQSNENYKQLMTELATTENLIAQTRTNYNTWVSQYNTYVRKFPNSMILNMLGYERQGFEKLNYDVSSDAPTNLFD
jgi:LemA protein